MFYLSPSDFGDSRDLLKIQIIFGFSMAGYVSLFDLGESRDDVEVDYNSLHHYRVKMFILIIVLNAFV